MTPSARKKHLSALKDLTEEAGFEEDNWGNFKSKDGKFRIKFKKVNLRIEHKNGTRWVSGGFSVPYSKIPLEEWRHRLTIYKESYNKEKVILPPKRKPVRLTSKAKMIEALKGRDITVMPTNTHRDLFIQDETNNLSYYVSIDQIVDFALDD